MSTESLLAVSIGVSTGLAIAVAYLGTLWRDEYSVRASRDGTPFVSVFLLHTVE